MNTLNQEHVGSGLLAVRVEQLEAVAAIKALQHELGYRLALGDAAGATQLFASNGTIEVNDEGKFRGHRDIAVRLSQLLRLDEPEGDSPEDERLPMVRAHLQIMPVITVAADGESADATWRDFDAGGGPIEAYWAEGPQEVSYTRTENGWRIQQLHWLRHIHVPYDGGWQEHATQFATAQWPMIAESSFHFLADEAKETKPEGRARDSTRLDERIQVLEDTREIENLIGVLGYYLDKRCWKQAEALFVGDPHELWPLFNPNDVGDTTENMLRDTMFTQATVTASGNRAQATWRAFAQWAQHGEWHEWGLATLVASFVRTAHGWRIERISVPSLTFTPYDLGWSRAQSHLSPTCRESGEQPPRTSISVEHLIVDPAPQGDLELRVRRVEAALEIERTQHIYGYYLATFEWERLTELFTEDGTIEVALRGVYRGHGSIRRSLDLYGTNPEYGRLHNHMQFQPVIHVDADAKRATLRARLFSMMGQFGVSSSWAAGVYDNVFTATDSGWKFSVDRIKNTYFAPYAIGWKELPKRLAPGINPTNPPDSDPTEMFALYPEPEKPYFAYPDPL